MNAKVVYQGAVAPESLRFRVLQGESEIDLTTVTAVAFDVRQPNGSMLAWSASISGTPTASTLVAEHGFNAPDTAQLGVHVIVAKLTVPGGLVRSEPVLFSVVDPFAIGG